VLVNIDDGLGGLDGSCRSRGGKELTAGLSHGDSFYVHQ
jgi:hypothetical protein